MEQVNVVQGENSDKPSLHKSTITMEMKYKFTHNLLTFILQLTVLMNMMYNKTIFMYSTYIAK